MSKSKRASRQTRTAETADKPTVSPILILGITAIIAVIVGALLIFNVDTGTSQPTAGVSTEKTEFPTKGNPDALVTITDFSDYG